MCVFCALAVSRRAYLASHLRCLQAPYTSCLLSYIGVTLFLLKGQYHHLCLVSPMTCRGGGGYCRWLCGDVIGEGAFGTVHMGLNLETGELMAVKSITLDQGDLTSGDAKSFHNEIAILRDNK